MMAPSYRPASFKSNECSATPRRYVFIISVQYEEQDKAFPTCGLDAIEHAGRRRDAKGINQGPARGKAGHQSCLEHWTGNARVPSQGHPDGTTIRGLPGLQPLGKGVSDEEGYAGCQGDWLVGDTWGDNMNIRALSDPLDDP